MGRYLTQTTDKAEQLEEWVQRLVNETNRKLDGSELYGASLWIPETVEVSGQEYNHGSVNIHIRYASKEPSFLTEGDKKSWYSRMKELAKKRFSIDATIASELDYASIPFEEPSEEELYFLTPNKESTLRAGFDRVRRFVEWYCSAVREYSGVVQAHDERVQKYWADLEHLSE